MYLLDLTIEHRVIIGISAMVLLFTSFLIAFISSQRRKLQYHKELHSLHEEQQQLLTEQNTQLEQKVADRTRELQQQKEALQTSLNQLKATQLQLVQKEKLASLGEMAAGIAHEIQNPLNFVNNFSEISTELLEDLEKEITQQSWEEALPLSKAVKENLAKVTHHGKRAEAIVKGMLQHATVSSTTKELTDINQLVFEYLQLTYQSIKAKYRGFEAELSTEFDLSLEKIEVYPQDLGRVFVNLYTNAFYSMQKKKNRLREAYHPEMVVATKHQNNHLTILVKDNGEGIPQKILGKIYQPFFTTKPAGEGTGLGLSLSYDIVIRGHGGELLVKTEEGEGVEFIVQLPL